ncbi:MAG: prepilin-type N-terminal cleavage/methylation domain-containing protein [Erysipelotrichaceae bacterium]|nr:prepilin-type N-terminal cleavage/methylation domain-containing protein [Erysipelotrichaceae bacterium]
MKKLNKKGFTLAELLIVVAIIAVLVAISIPIFTAQLEKARDAVSVSNIRAAYAEASASYLTSNGKDVTEGRVVVDADAKTATVTGVNLKGTQSGWSGLDAELDGFTHTTMTDAIGGEPGTYTAVFTFSDEGTCTLTSLAEED